MPQKFRIPDEQSDWLDGVNVEETYEIEDLYEGDDRNSEMSNN